MKIMKKAAKITGMTIAALLVIIIAAAVIIPIAFRDKIKAKVEDQISSTVNAKVTFTNYKLSLFRAFPNIAFSLSDLSITGVDRFEGDTLTYVKSIDLIFNLMSIFSDAGYEVRSIIIDRPVVNALVLQDGTVNWDIMKEDTVMTAENAAEPSSFRMLLRDIVIHEGRVGYSDMESDRSAKVTVLELNISGDMTSSRTVLKMDMTAPSVSFVM